MLKTVPSILSPELLEILMEMGHADEIVIGDGNFPAASLAQRLVRADGHGVPPLLDAIWDTYRGIIHRRSPDASHIEFIERFAFYERAENAYAIVATGEQALYANFILKKGLVVT